MAAGRTGSAHADTNDYPPEKIAFFMRTPVWCRSRAEGLGEHVTELVVGLLADKALHHLRAAQGIVALADKYVPSDSTRPAGVHCRSEIRPTAR